MDGLFTQCSERCPRCGRQCVRLKPHEDDCQDQNARDVYCHRWRSN
jgi:hypothetical protein